MLFGLSACGDFKTADINLKDILLSDVEASCTEAYYLDVNGTLYSPGADSDAGAFVVYKDTKKGIIANDVKSFCIIPGGGLYISNSNELYIWNRKVIPHFNYTTPKKQFAIAENIGTIRYSDYGLLMCDISANLYLCGEFQNESFDIRNPQYISSDVSSYDINNNCIIYALNDGTVNIYGDNYLSVPEEFLNKFVGTDIKDIYLENDYVAILSDDILWFFGDYIKLTTGISSGLTNTEKLISEDVTAVDTSINSILTLNSKGEISLWGKCVSNDEGNTHTPKDEFYEERKIAENAKNLFVNEGCLGYIDNSGKSHIYYATGYPEFYGNTTKDDCVGINRTPITWE